MKSLVAVPVSQANAHAPITFVREWTEYAFTQGRLLTANHDDRHGGGVRPGATGVIGGGGHEIHTAETDALGIYLGIDVHPRRNRAARRCDDDDEDDGFETIP